MNEIRPRLRSLRLFVVCANRGPATQQLVPNPSTRYSGRHGLDHLRDTDSVIQEPFTKFTPNHF